MMTVVHERNISGFHLFLIPKHNGRRVSIRDLCLLYIKNKTTRQESCPEIELSENIFTEAYALDAISHMEKS